MPMSMLLTAVTVNCYRSHVLKCKKQTKIQTTHHVFSQNSLCSLLARSHIHVNETALRHTWSPVTNSDYLLELGETADAGADSSAVVQCVEGDRLTRNSILALCLSLALWGCLSRTTLNKATCVMSSLISWMLLLVWRLQGTFLVNWSNWNPWNTMCSNRLTS